MNRILLNFKSTRLEKQFVNEGKDRARSLLRGFILISLLECFLVGGIVAASETSDWKLLLKTGLQALISLLGLIKFSHLHLNLLLAGINVSIAIIQCLIFPSDVLTPIHSIGLVLKHCFLLQGSNFFLKIVTVLNIAIIYLVFSLGSVDGGFVAGISLFLYKMYEEDTALRNKFLVQRNEEEMNFLVKRLLPVSMVISRYDKKEERIYFHMSNSKLQKQFQIKDDDSMKAFFLKVHLQPQIEQPDQATPQTTLFNYLHLQAKQQCFKNVSKKGKTMMMNSPPLPQIPAVVSSFQEIPDALNSDNIKTNNPQPNLNNHCLSSAHEELISPGSMHSGEMFTANRTAQAAAASAAYNAQDSDILTQKHMRRKEHKRTIIKQFTNLNFENTGQHNEPQIRENSSNVKQQNQNKEQAKKEGFAEDIFDRLDFFYGILQEDKQKILNIKIYTYVLEEIYQVIIFEDETLQGKVDYLTKLNKFYIQVFELMLRKLRMPIASSLFKVKKTVNNIRNMHQQIRSRKSSFPLNLPQDSIETSINYPNIHRPRGGEFSSDLSGNAISSHLLSSQIIENRPRGNTQTQDIEQIKIDISNQQSLISNVQDLHYSSYNILNNLYNYSDVFLIFNKGQIQLNCTNHSLIRIIKDLKQIFGPEYRSRNLQLYFINNLTEEEQYINTDDKYLKQILINLINNSLQAISKQQQGYTAVQFKINQSNDEVIDVSIMDTGPGISQTFGMAESLLLQNMNLISLEKNMGIRDLRIGLPISEKIVGKLGPFEKIRIDKNQVKFQIYKDFNGLIKEKENFNFQKHRKSFFTKNRGGFSEDADLNQDDEDAADAEQDICYEIQKQQIVERDLSCAEMSRHKNYFSDEN